MITITHNRLVVSVSGADEAVLAPVLSYDHKTMERSWTVDPKSGRNRLVEKNVSKTRPLYTVVNNNIIFQQGLLDRVTSLLNTRKTEYTYNDIGEVDCVPDYANFRKQMPSFEFRPNQDLAVGIVTSLACGQIVAAPAFGKTQIIAVLCALYPDKKIIITTPGAQLAKDTHARIAGEFPREKIGLLGAGGADVGRITVSTYHSLHKYPATDPDIVFVDECVSGDTVIITEKGPTRIDEARESKLVLTYDGLCPVFKPILDWWSTEDKETLEVLYHGGKFRCTENHKIMTLSGWITAKDLKPGMQVLGNSAPRVLNKWIRPFVRLLGTLWYSKYDTVDSVRRTGTTETVYDIEVEGTHSFFANGILVHNCHRSASPLLSNAISRFIRVQKVFGFTASPEGRSDGAETVTESILGPIRLNIPYSESVKQGVVSEMTVLMVDVLSGPDEKNFKEAITKQRNLIWRNLYRNKVIAQAVSEYTKEDNTLGLQDPQVLILVGTTVHLENLSKLLPDYELVYNSPGKSGLPKMNNKAREDIFNKFKTQEVRKVIATSCWGTGVDFPDLDIIVTASGKSGPIDVIQHTGRATRRGSGDKKMGYVIDFNDQWCKWGKWKATKRKSLYKSMGWKILEN